MFSFRPARGAHRFAEFLPDVDGMVEHGHSPLAGALILLIATVFGGMLTWSALAEVEQVVRAEGKVEPAERIKLINHPDGGRIAEVHVTEGQRVGAGDALVSFDPELARAELDELLARWQLKTAEAARLRAEAFGEPLELPEQLGDLRPDLVRQQSELLEERTAAAAGRVEALAQAAQRRASDVRTLRAELARLGESRLLLEEQVGAVRQLAAQGLYPRMRLVAFERELSDVAGEIAKAREQLNAAEAALGEAESQHAGFEREWRSRLLSELATLDAEREQLAEAMKREQAHLRNLIVRAPVDGIVQDLSVTAAGQSVGSNQPLMKLVPTGGGLVVEAKVRNEDIGYVQFGQPARIKVRAYDFLRYGTLAGRIDHIAADASVDQTTGRLIYDITVRTEETVLRNGSEQVSVLPGMAVDVDLLVGERTVLSYLTDRIFRLKEDAFRQG